MCAINCGCALPSHLSESMDVSWRDEAAALRDSNEVKEEQISVLRASVSDAGVCNDGTGCRHRY